MTESPLPLQRYEVSVCWLFWIWMWDKRSFREREESWEAAPRHKQLPNPSLTSKVNLRSSAPPTAMAHVFHCWIIPIFLVGDAMWTKFRQKKQEKKNQESEETETQREKREVWCPSGLNVGLLSVSHQHKLLQRQEKTERKSCLWSGITFLQPSRSFTAPIMPHLTEHYWCIMGSEVGGRGDVKPHE